MSSRRRSSGQADSGMVGSGARGLPHCQRRSPVDLSGSLRQNTDDSPVGMPDKDRRASSIK